MYICAAAQGKENSMEQRRISFLTVEWAKMDGWSSMQESAGIDMYVLRMYLHMYVYGAVVHKGQLILE